MLLNTIGMKAAQAGKFLYQNLLSNGDFSNGTTWWAPNTSNTLSVVNGRLRNTLSTANNAYARQSLSFANGKKYYIKCNGYPGSGPWRFDMTNSQGFQFGVDSNIQSSQGVYSIVYSAAANDTITARLMTATTNDYAYAEFDNVVVVDLTAVFGAGNEPDKAWCDINIAPNIKY